MGLGLGQIAVNLSRANNQNPDRIVDIVEFVSSPWGLNFDGQQGRPRLYDVQNIILKAHYGLELDDKRKFSVWKDWRQQDKWHFTEREYLEYLYNEGRCNIKEVDHDRRELVLVIGRRSGKCILGDSLVLTDRGIIRIDTLGDPDGLEVQPLDVIVAQEGNQKSHSKFFYNGGTRHTRTFTTRCGYQLGGTDNHRIKVLTEQGIVDWKYLADLKVGDVACLHRGTDLWATQYVNCTPYHNDKGLQNLTFPDVLDEEWGLLLGYLVGDGLWNYRGRVEITAEHPETWERLKEIFTRLFGKYSICMDKRRQNTGVIKFGSVGMRQFLHDLGFLLGTERDAKMVPWAILQSPKSVVQAFLRGLFEADGGVSKNGKVVDFSTASYRLAHEVQTLLLNLGIVSKVHPKTVKGRVYWILTIRGLRSRKAFADMVGFDSHKKMNPLLKSVQQAQEEGGDTESIPNQIPWLHRMLESVPRNHQGQGWNRMFLRETMGNTIKGEAGDLTYSRLAEVLSVAEDMSADSDSIQHFKALQQLDYFFDPVTGIEEGINPVFDLNVPDGESFVANGLVNHNTFLAAAISAYETYKLLMKGSPQRYYGLPPGNQIGIVSVATDKDQAGILFNEVSSHYRNCFAAETEVITAEGIKPIGSLAGSVQTLLTTGGAWVEAPITSFGKQKLWKIVLRRQGIEKSIYCTEDHRWFARDARKAHRGKGFVEFTTKELRPGKHHLQAIFGHSYKNIVTPSPFGIAHGFTFGDGSTTAQRQATSVWMIGEKDSCVQKYFSLCPMRKSTRIDGVEASALPNFFRDLPSIRENKAYLLGWLMGYFAADGSVKNGQVTISSISRRNIEFVRDVCAVIGIGAYSISSSTRVSNLTHRPFTMYSLNLMRQTLDASFFLIPAHKEKFLEVGGDDVKRVVQNWTVQSVEETDRYEEVFCATVEGYGAFALADNILTGNCGYFSPYTANNTQSYARFQTPKDIEDTCRYEDDAGAARATIKVSFKSCIAKGLRGPGNIIIIMDEAAHFTDNGQSSAESVYNAITPSTATFSPKDALDSRIPIGPVEGRIINISSPLARQGQFYKLYQIGMKGTTASDTMLVVQAPTWEVNPTLPPSEFEKHYLKDPVIFQTEFGAQFSDRARGWIEREQDLLDCIDDTLRPAVQPPARRPHFIGIDVGLVGDGSAVAIGHMESRGDQRIIVLDYIGQIKAGEGDYKKKERLDFSDVVDWVYDLSRRFYIAHGMCDQYTGIPFEQALQKKGLSQIKSEHMTRDLNSDMFRNFKDMMYDRRLSLYDYPKIEGHDHCDYIEELLELQAETHSKYITTVQAPQVEGKHDDRSDALVRMVWLASQHIGSPKYLTGAHAGGIVSGNPSRQSPRAYRKGFLSARQMGSSPDRQISRSFPGRIRGRR